MKLILSWIPQERDMAHNSPSFWVSETIVYSLDDSQTVWLKIKVLDFLGGTVVKNPPANAGDTGSSPGPRRSHMPWSN